MAPTFHRYMTDRFPQVTGTRIIHAWIGNVFFTSTRCRRPGRPG
jgi:hypothetical protein